MLLDFRHLPHLKRAFPRATLPAGRRVALDRLARPPHPTCPRPAGPCRPLIRRPLPTTCPCRLESASPVRRTRRRPPAIHQRRPTTRPLLPRTALLRQTIHQLVRDTRRPLPQTTHRPLPRTVRHPHRTITLPRRLATLRLRPPIRRPVPRTVRRRPIIRRIVPAIRLLLPTICRRELAVWPVRATRRPHPAIRPHRPTTHPLRPRIAHHRQTLRSLVRDIRRPLPQTTHRPLPRTVPNHRTIITLPRHPATLPHRPLTRPPVHRTVRRRPIIRPLVPDIHRPLPTICRPIWAWPVRRTRPVHPATLHHRPTHKHVLTPTVWSSGVFTVILII